MMETRRRRRACECILVARACCPAGPSWAPSVNTPYLPVIGPGGRARGGRSASPAEATVPGDEKCKSDPRSVWLTLLLALLLEVVAGRAGGAKERGRGRGRDAEGGGATSEVSLVYPGGQGRQDSPSRRSCDPEETLSRRE